MAFSVITNHSSDTARFPFLLQLVMSLFVEWPTPAVSELIVGFGDDVDAAEEDRIRALQRHVPVPLRVTRLEDDWGSANHWQLIPMAKEELVCKFDNDACAMGPGWWQCAVDQFSEQRLGLVARVGYYFDQAVTRSIEEWKHGREVDTICGWCYFVRRSAWIGVPPAPLLTAHNGYRYDDLPMGFHVREHGWTVRVAAMDVAHTPAPSVRRGGFHLTGPEALNRRQLQSMYARRLPMLGPRVHRELRPQSQRGGRR
ncbi:MAG: hypothetical protein GF320_09940 [Armatimonadia bacterium]|nr:hypothetical protein [Armatimonadia bacterium]